MHSSKISMMVSYSHRDEEYRKRLQTALSPLRRLGLIDVWSDHRIAPGADVDSKISEAIESVDVVLLLVSPDFIHSDYCYEKELAVALRRHEANDCVVLPVIVRACDWTSLPFGRLKASPSDGKPISAWSDADEAWLDVVKAVRELADNSAIKRNNSETAPLRTTRDSLKEEFLRLTQTYESRGSPLLGACTTGLADFDKAWGVLSSPELVVIASRPGMGQHDMLLGMGLNSAIRHKSEILYVSPRDTSSLVMRRAISWVGRINRVNLASGDLSEQDWPRLANAIAILSELAFHIDETRALSCASMILRLRDLCEGIKPKLIFIEGIDYFAHVAEAPAESRDASYISKQLRVLGRDYGVPIVCSLSLAPGLEGRLNRRPLMSDLKAWHCLEEDADRIAFLYRDDYYNAETAERGVCEIDIVKNNFGSREVVRAVYLADYCSFENFMFSWNGETTQKRSD